MRLTLRAVPVVACVAALAGCGDSSGDRGADPATAVPADAAGYAEGLVRPEGRKRDEALAAAGKLLRTGDPGRGMRELVEQALDDNADGSFSYARDLEPWLGDRVAVWASAEVEDPSIAFVAGASDADKARDVLADAAERSRRGYEARSYEGVEYAVNDEGVALGVVGDFGVAGHEAAFKRTVDAVNGDSLAETRRYRDAVGRLAGERLAHFYIDIRAFLGAGLRDDPSAAVQRMGVLGLSRVPPLAGALLADGDRIAVETVSPRSSSDLMSRITGLLGSGEVPLLRELPGDAWAALGAHKLGESAQATFDAIAGLQSGALMEEIEHELGLNLRDDVFAWVGDAALFVRGASEDDVEGGLVIEVTDAGRAERAFGKIVGLIQSAGGGVRPIRLRGADSAFLVSGLDTPHPVVLARGPGKVVAGLGERAAADALAPVAKLGDAELLGQAQSVLGESPSFLLSVPAALTLIGTTDGAADPHYQRVKPYLDALSVLAAGSRVDGDQVTQRFAAGLK